MEVILREPRIFGKSFELGCLITSLVLWVPELLKCLKKLCPYTKNAQMLKAKTNFAIWHDLASFLVRTFVWVSQSSAHLSHRIECLHILAGMKRFVKFYQGSLNTLSVSDLLFEAGEKKWSGCRSLVPMETSLNKTNALQIPFYYTTFRTLFCCIFPSQCLELSNQSRQLIGHITKTTCSHKPLMQTWPTFCVLRHLILLKNGAIISYLAPSFRKLLHVVHLPC